MEIVRPVLDLFEQQAYAKSIRLRLSFDFDDVTVQIDEMRVKQILINLIGNAIKFSNDLDQVTVEVRQVRCQDNQIYFEIRVLDQGIGLNDTDRKNIFQPFFRSSCRANQNRSVGYENGCSLNVS